MTRFILKGTFLIEAAGAVLLLPVFYGDYQKREFGCQFFILFLLFVMQALIFWEHLQNPFPSLTGYSANVLINVVIMLLIIIGGIGFLTWDDIYTNKMKFKRYRMQSKIILVTTACLILIPIIFFFTCDFKKFIRRESLISCSVSIGNYKNCRI